MFMFGFASKKRAVDVTKTVDEIKSATYEVLKPLGFRKYGRTIHRFVSNDISQVINFQSGMPQHGMRGFLCVNIGIRIPECAECVFHPEEEKKKYYQEYKCNIRSRLGTVSGKKETWYDLQKGADRISKRITDEILKTVIPAFEVLCDRQAILLHRKDYPSFDTMSRILLDEAMIYGHLGDTKKAKVLFERYYQTEVDDYNNLMTNGTKHYLKKGESIVYLNQVITAEKDGYVTLYGASHEHIEYLDDLAIKLGLR